MNQNLFYKAIIGALAGGDHDHVVDFVTNEKPHLPAKTNDRAKKRRQQELENRYSKLLKKDEQETWDTT